MSERIKKLGRELADQYMKGYGVGRREALADATARIEGIPNEYGVPPHTEYADGVAREAFRHGIGAALAALTQLQTEKEA